MTTHKKNEDEAKHKDTKGETAHRSLDGGNEHAKPQGVDASELKDGKGKEQAKKKTLSVADLPPLGKDQKYFLAPGSDEPIVGEASKAQIWDKKSNSWIRAMR